MRPTIRLMTTTAIALIAGISLLAAQGFTRDPGGPAATPNVPGQERPSDTRPKDGTPHRPESQGTPQDRGQMQRGQEPKQPPGQRDGRPSDPTTGQATPQRNPEPQRGSKGDRQPIQKGQPGQMRPDQSHGQLGAPPAGQADQTQGQAGAHTNLSAEQRTRIRETMLTVEGAPRASGVNFALTVGTPVPNTVRVAPIPSIVVDIEPTWRGFRYFLVGDDIIVVNPSTHLIVAVITA